MFSAGFLVQEKVLYSSKTWYIKHTLRNLEHLLSQYTTNPGRWGPCCAEPFCRTQVCPTCWSYTATLPMQETQHFVKTLRGGILQSFLINCIALKHELHRWQCYFMSNGWAHLLGKALTCYLMVFSMQIIRVQQCWFEQGLEPGQALSHVQQQHLYSRWWENF